jgi:hypothetical protein
MASPWQRITTIKPIRNGLRPAPLTQFAITFCDGDLDPDTKRAACLAGDLNPQSSVKNQETKVRIKEGNREQGTGNS